MSKESRGAKRAPVNIRVYFGKGNADRLGFVQDISERGLRIRARKLYPPNTPLVLHVEVPGHGMTRATGIVKRARMVEPALDPFQPAEMGIIILEGNKQLEEMIQGMLAEFQEQREQRRKELRIEISQGDAQRLIVEYTQNIGHGGIFIVTDNPPPRGTLVDAVMKLPGLEKEIHARCVVVRICTDEEAATRGLLPGAGLRFMSFREGDKKQYLDFLAGLDG